MPTNRGLDRIIAFVDAVVAIAITLLVLPPVDALSGTEPRTSLATVLADTAPQFGAFVLSFLVIARLWWAHHRIVEQVGGFDGAFVLVNLAWLLTIVIVPFATQVLAVYRTGRPAVAIYVGSLTVSSACLTLLNVLVWRRRALRREGVDDARASPRAALVTTGTFVVALGVGVLVPRVNYYGLLLLFLTEPIERWLAHRFGGTAG